MANLTPLITTIREAKKGRDVREAIAGTMVAVNTVCYRDWETDRKSTRLNSSHSAKSRMPSSA